MFSPRIFGNMDSQEEYSCECGKTHGKFYEGKICPKCNTEVRFIGLNIDRYGWIDLSLSKYSNGVCIEKRNGCHVIQYIAYSQLEKVIGREHLRNIIHVRNTITVEGDIDTTEIDEIRIQDPHFKYYFIGIENLYNQYEEILSYYYELNNKDNKLNKLYEYLKNKDEVFIDKIPVVSIILRPAMRTSDGLKLDDINILYQHILKNVEILKDVNIIDIIRDSTIEEIQANYMLLSEKVLDNIKTKFGLIRNQICGNRINFSARNIISPAKAGYKMDEIILPYLTFLELYKFEIINILKNTENISFSAAQKEWYYATLKFNNKVYNIMKKMITDNEIGVLLNRNPTIAYGSILYLKVAGIKKDITDVTMSISNNILTLLAG